MGNDGSQPTKKKEEDESWIVSSDVTAAAVPSSAGSLTLLYSLLCLPFFLLTPTILSCFLSSSQFSSLKIALSIYDATAVWFRC